MWKWDNKVQIKNMGLKKSWSTYLIWYSKINGTTKFINKYKNKRYTILFVWKWDKTKRVGHNLICASHNIACVLTLIKFYYWTFLEPNGTFF